MSEAEGRLAARRLGGVALLLAVSVALSRVLGYAREAVIAWRLGVSAEVDAYRAAFLLPDMMNYFLAGGALSIAFIPMYARVRRARGAAVAAKLLAEVLGTTTAIAAAVTALLWAVAPPLVDRLFGFDRAALDLTARLTRIVLPGLNTRRWASRLLMVRRSRKARNPPVAGSISASKNSLRTIV